MEKRCSKCGIYKDTSLFHKNRVMADGMANQCIPCFRETHKRYRDSPKGIARQRAYVNSDIGKDVRRRANKKYKETEASKSSYASYYLRHKQKNRCRGRVFDAVRSGKMPPADSLICVHCGDSALEYHHHNGYDDAHSLDVVPLCKKCHVTADKQSLMDAQAIPCPTCQHLISIPIDTVTLTTCPNCNQYLVGVGSDAVGRAIPIPCPTVAEPLVFNNYGVWQGDDLITN